MSDLVMCDASLEGPNADAIADRVREAEQDYLTCVADYGCESGEAMSARWHLNELQRKAQQG